MVCLCSKGSGVVDDAAVNAKDKRKLNKSSVVKKEETANSKPKRKEETANSKPKQKEETIANGDLVVRGERTRGKTIIVERPKNGHRHRRAATIDLSGSARVADVPWGATDEQSAAGWPVWLSSVAGEAIQRLLPGVQSHSKR